MIPVASAPRAADLLAPSAAPASSDSGVGFGAALALTLTAIILVFSVLQQMATRDRG